MILSTQSLSVGSVAALTHPTSRLNFFFGDKSVSTAALAVFAVSSDIYARQIIQIINPPVVVPPIIENDNSYLYDHVGYSSGYTDSRPSQKSKTKLKTSAIFVDKDDELLMQQLITEDEEILIIICEAIRRALWH